MKNNKYSIVIKDLNKSFRNGKQIIKESTLSFLYGAKIGILGVNGSGKSTLLNILSGLDKEYNGEVLVTKGMKVGLLAQEPTLDESLTVKENILYAVRDLLELLNKFNEISEKLGTELEEEELNNLINLQAEYQEKIEKENGWELDRKIEIAMNALRCPESDANILNLSGGEKRRVALCRLLLEEPDILLLDEPTNHLDAETVAWLEQHLDKFKGTVIAVTHDRYFLDNVASWILEVDKGNLLPFEGNYTSWLENKSKRLLLEDNINKSLNNTIKQELEWVRSSPRARQSKNQARLNSYNTLVEKAESRQGKNITGEIYIPPGPRLGNKVIEAKDIKKILNNKLLINEFSFAITPGAIIGIIGPNGIGKTTLLNLIAKNDTLDAGSIEYGSSVKIGYVNQSRDSLNPENTIWEEISDTLENIQLGKNIISSRAYVSWFNFKGSDQQKKVGFLSGGERNRVHLAKVLKSEANVILLDEPTNDLDVDTLRSLEYALQSFSGCVLVTSHDRYFLDRICTHIISFEGEASVECFQGGYREYEDYKLKKLGLNKVEPKKAKFSFTS